MSVAALLDLDGTLLALNSGLAWYAHERRTGRVGLGSAARRAARAVAYLCGAIDLDALARKTVAELAGVSEADIRDAQQRWYDSDVRHAIRPGAAALVDAHRRQGHLVALVTGASPYVAAQAAHDLDITAVVATRLEVRDGRFTGRIDGPVCLGEGKLAATRQWAADAGVDLASSWYYGDDMDDLPMLGAVGHPVVVHPTRRLRTEAERRGFPVHDLASAIELLS